jgi:hypothetical protein
MQQLKPALLDVVKRDADYVLFYGTEPLSAPDGRPFVHIQPRVIEHIHRELCISGRMQTDEINACTLYMAATAAAANHMDNFNAALEQDPLIRSRFGERPDIADLDAFLEVLGEQQQQLGFFFGGITGTLKSLNRFLMDYTEGHVNVSNITQPDMVELVRGACMAMHEEQQGILQLLCAAHESGLLLPLLLIIGRLTPSEYANTLFSIHLPAANTDACPRPFADLFRHPLDIPAFLPDWKHPEACFAHLREQAARVTEYLSCLETTGRSGSGVRELIATGEGFNLEFKSSLRWNIKAGKKDPAIEHAALKTISAFLNSSGGTLLIGVRDDGSAEDIKIDQFPNEDRYALHFWNLVKSSMGQDITPCIQASFEKHEEQTVFMVRCARSPRPVFLNQKGFDEEFYIRVGPSSARLSIAEALKYIATRFQDAM